MLVFVLNTAKCLAHHTIKLSIDLSIKSDEQIINFPWFKLFPVYEEKHTTKIYHLYTFIKFNILLELKKTFSFSNLREFSMR